MLTPGSRCNTFFPLFCCCCFVVFILFFFSPFSTCLLLLAHLQGAGHTHTVALWTRHEEFPDEDKNNWTVATFTRLKVIYFSLTPSVKCTWWQSCAHDTLGGDASDILPLLKKITSYHRNGAFFAFSQQQRHHSRHPSVLLFQGRTTGKWFIVL